MNRKYRIATGAVLLILGCGSSRDGTDAGSRDTGVQGMDAGGARDASDVDAGAPEDAGALGADASVAAGECDLTGVWIVAQVVFAEALGARQKAVNWSYHRIAQAGEAFTIEDSLSCGFRVTGTTTVNLPDPTLEALARRTRTSLGRTGTFRKDGDRCRFDLARMYDLRGADLTRFLTDHWTLGDPPKDLGEFPPLPRDAAEGMEDWDSDTHEGITLSTGFGPRYVAQRDWNEHAGTAPTWSTEFGGPGEIVVRWDLQESVSRETNALLRTTATPAGDGHARYALVGERLVIEPGNELASCKNVQRLALEIFPDP